MITNELVRLCVSSAITLYMLAILLRWLGPWIEVDFYRRALRWIPRITDPLLNLVRRMLPAMGPMDWGPMASLMLVWMVRIVLAGH